MLQNIQSQQVNNSQDKLYKSSLSQVLKFPNQQLEVEHDSVTNNVNASQQFTQSHNEQEQEMIHEAKLTSNSSKHSMKVHISSFKKYGGNVFIFFDLIKKLIVLFSILSVFSLIAIIYNSSRGMAYSRDAEGANVAFGRASLGSHSSSANNQSTAKEVNQAIITINIIIFFIFLNYWSVHSQKQLKAIQYAKKLSNHAVLQVQGAFINSLTQKEDLKVIFQPYGKIVDLIKVENYGEILSILKKMQELQTNVDLLRQSLKNKESEDVKAKINQKQKEIQEFKLQIKEELKNNPKKQVLKYYLQMEREEICQKILEDQTRNNKICSKKIGNEGLVYNDKDLTVGRCAAQSWGIYWQNQHVGIKQLILPNIALIVAINAAALFSIFIFSMVSTMAEPAYYYPSLPSNRGTQTFILAQTNSTMVSSWCLSGNTQTNSKLIDTCQSYKNLSGNRMLIYLMISLVMVVTRYTIKRIVVAMKSCLRFKDHAEESAGVFIHLFMNYTIISIVVALSVQTNLFGTAMVDLVRSFISNVTINTRLKMLQQHYDYTSEWYIDYGFQLTLNYIIIMVLPHTLIPLYLVVTKKLMKCLSRWRNGDQLEMEIEEKIQFELQDNYASLLMSVIVGMAFAGLMPVLIPLVLLNLILKFFLFRYTFVNFNKVSNVTDRLIADKSTPILTIACIAYCLNSIWGLGAQTVFKPDFLIFGWLDQNSNAHTIQQALMVFVRRFFNALPLPLFLILGLLSLNFKKGIYNKVVRLLQLIACKQKGEEVYEITSSSSDGKERQCSYNPHLSNSYQIIFRDADKFILHSQHQMSIT